MNHVFGTIEKDGSFSKNQSSGIQTIVNDDTGEYTIIFVDGSFTQPPSVVVSQNFPGGNNFSSDGGSTNDNATIIAVSTEKVKVKTGRGDGSAENRNFSFIALGN